MTRADAGPGKPPVHVRVRHALGDLLGRPRRWRYLTHLPKGAVCAEIGVFKGDFSRQILRVTRPRELHLIDGWWHVEGESYAQAWYASEGETDTRTAFREVEALAAEHPQCTIHVGDDLDILPGFPDDYFDWVYLDSSHRYDHTVQELEILRHKTRIIAGHDWYPDPGESHHGVYRAVTEFCDRHGWVVGPLDEWTQWLIRRP